MSRRLGESPARPFWRPRVAAVVAALLLVVGGLPVGSRQSPNDLADVELAAVTLSQFHKISGTSGDVPGPLNALNEFGDAVEVIGDLDDDGIVDLAVGHPSEDDGASNAGQVWILFMNADRTVRASQVISDSQGGLTQALAADDAFGHSLAALGDLDGDGVEDIAVGAQGLGAGAVIVLFLNTDGTVKSEHVIDAAELSGFVASSPGDLGYSLDAIGDIDGDGTVDLAIGDTDDDTNGTDSGAFYVVTLNTDGSLSDATYITEGQSGFTGDLDTNDQLGTSISNAGDVDGNGHVDIAVGARYDDDGGTDAGAVYVALMGPGPGVIATVKHSAASAPYAGSVDAGDEFGHAVEGAGDLNGDGFPDLLIGASRDDETDTDGGAVWVAFLDRTGAASSTDKISETSAGFGATIDTTDEFGRAVASFDLDGDGAMDLVAGTPQDDEGNSDAGAVYVFETDLTGNGILCADVDLDTVCDHFEDADIDLDGDPTTNPGPDSDGDTVPDYLDADDDGDGLPTLSENPDRNADGSPQDAVDSDHDGEPDYLDGHTGEGLLVLAQETKISSTVGGLTGPLSNGDLFARDVAPIGDLDEDGVVDLVVGARSDSDGGTQRGAAWILFMNSDGTVKAEQKISSTQGGLVGPLDDNDIFGHAVAAIGDLNGDGRNEVAVGADFDDDGAVDGGAVYVLFLNGDGTVASEQKISNLAGGFGGVLDVGELFGQVGRIGDLDDDGIPDLAVGAYMDDDGAPDAGAVWILFMNPDGSVKAEQKISATSGGLTAPLDANDTFGTGVSGLGDVDGDGVEDIAVGARGDDDGSSGNGAAYVLFLNTDGTVKAEQKISATTGGLTSTMSAGGWFGSSVGGAGDFDDDGTPDLLVGAFFDTDGGPSRGAVYVIALNADGTVKSDIKLSSTQGGFAGPLDNSDLFGAGVASVGDLDGDGVIDFAVGSTQDDDGGPDRGAVYLVELAAGCIDADSDGLCNQYEDANTDLDGDPATNPGPDSDGDTIPNYLDSDDDGDSLLTSDESADQNGDGSPQDALDTDRDGQPDYLDAPTVAALVASDHETKVANGTGGLAAVLDGADFFGSSVSAAGDIDGDGVTDIVVGSPQDDDGTGNAGAVYVLFMNVDGSVRAEQKISNLAGGLSTPLAASDSFGASVVTLGDLDGDGVNDLVVGANGDDDGGSSRGAVYVLFLNPDGSVRAEQKVSDTTGGLTAVLDDGDNFGRSVAALGDLDDDGIPDLVVGADTDDDGGTDRGAVHVLLLNSDGTVKSEQKISDTTGGLAATLDNADSFGFSVAGPGDIDGDGVEDLAVGAYWDDDGAGDAGAAYVLFLNTDGTVKDEQKISNTAGGLGGGLDISDYFGISVGGVGDVDADGTPDLAVGALLDDDGGSNRGALRILTLNSDGTVKSATKFSNLSGGFAPRLVDGDSLGRSVASVGDLDGDGSIGLVVAAHADDTGASNAGSVYVLDLCIDADADGLCNSAEDANTDADDDPSTNPGPDTDGDTIPNHLDPDDDGDGIATSAEGADQNSDGSPQDALDTDFDGQPDYLDLPTAQTNAQVATEAKISATSGGFIGPLAADDFFGGSVASVGDVDGDGVVDLAVAAPGDDPGAVYLLLMNADRSVKSEHELSTADPLLTAELDPGDNFGGAVAGIGDVDGDGIPDVAVGARGDDDGASGSGAVYILFLADDGTASSLQKLSATQGSLATPPQPADNFGQSVAGLGDLDGDGIPDLAVGAYLADGALSDTGAVEIIFLNSDGTARAQHRIGDNTGDLSATLDSLDWFGGWVTAVGDLDGDGITDIAVGTNEDDVATNTGSVFILFLNADGTVKGEQRISATAGGLTGPLEFEDRFQSVSGVGDLNGDGRGDLAVGAYWDDDGATDAGALYVLFLNADGTVASEQKISNTTGGLAGPLGANDWFGHSVTGIGDLDGDGLIDLAVGASRDDDGQSNAGALHIISLAGVDLLVNSTGDASDAAPGDHTCDTGGTNSEGGPECTLRAAIEEANASATADTIHFSIPDSDPGHVYYQDNVGPGLGAPTVTALDDGSIVDFDPDYPISQFSWFNITLGTDLPVITDPITIDGYTQPGALANSTTHPAVTDAVLRIELDSLANYGLRISAGNSVIRGLVVDRAPFTAVQLDTAGGNTIAGNWIGTDITGTRIGDAGGFGIDVVSGSDGNTIGGSAPGDRNIITFNSSDGIELGSNGNIVDGNFVGLSAIGANGTIQDTGIDVTGANNQIGTASRGNRVVANVDTGIWISGPSGNIVQGNEVRDNQDSAVSVSNGSGHLIGGTNPGEGNTITGTLFATTAIGVAPAANDIAILGNSISDNDGIGIDLGASYGNGITPNDPGDGDAGANDQLNFPVITGASTALGTVTVDFDLDAPAGDYRVEAFTNPSGPDASGHGEGELFQSATTITHTGGGVESFQISYSGSPGFITLTATKESPGPVYGSTSEFSAASCGDSDGDGLCDLEEDANTDLDADPTTSPGPDTDGDTVPDYLDPDDDGDLLPTSLEQADPNNDGDPRDALDSDRDGQPDYLDQPTIATELSVVAEQKISALAGGLIGLLTAGDHFANRLAAIGDVDGDGVVDLAIGANLDDDGGADRGAVYIAFTNTDGTVKAEQKISSLAGGLSATLDDSDEFGTGVAGLGDINGDGVPDLAVGAMTDDDGGTNRGAVYILFLNSDGSVAVEQKISAVAGGLSATLDDSDTVGRGVAGIGDLDGDGVNDLAVTAPGDDDGGASFGAVYVLFLNSDGTVRAEQKISSLTGGLAPLVSPDGFGASVAALGDVDGDGVMDLAVGAHNDDTGGPDRGAVYVLFLNTDGTVKSQTKLAHGIGGLPIGLDDVDRFGRSTSGIGDFDGDGVPDLAVGTALDDDGGTSRGAIYVVALNTDGTARSASKLSSTQGGLTGPLANSDFFGHGVAGIGDIDGNGSIDLAVGAYGDDDGGAATGAAYVIGLGVATTVTVNSTGDASDVSPGDGSCDTGGLNAAASTECTLRAALEEANASAAVDTVAFSIPAADAGHTAGVWTITPATPLADVTAPVTLDATTQPGAACDGAAGMHTIAVALDGSSLLPGQPMLSITANSSTVAGLSIDQVAGADIAINGDLNTIRCNFLGLRADGATSAGPDGSAVYVNGVDNTIGGASLADLNVLSTGGTYGVDIDTGSLRTLVEGNRIGTDVSGSFAVANGGAGVIGGGDIDTTVRGNLISGNLEGVHAQGSNSMRIENNLIGVTIDGSAALPNTSRGVFLQSGTTGVVIDGNQISGNGADAVLADAAATGTIIVGNRIGLDAAGTGPVANGAGVQTQGPATIGGPTAPEMNVISGNTGYGIRITGAAASGTTIEGNRIGTNAAGDGPLPNTGTGVEVLAGADNVVIGGTTPQESNIIAGNSGDGVEVNSSATDNLTIHGNSLGVDVNGDALGNGSFGVHVSGSAGHTIGGPNPGEGNVISGNTSGGVFVDGSTSTGNVISGNIIGLDPAGVVARPNGGAGVAIWTFADGNTIGGSTVGHANTISGNAGDGVVFGGANNSNVVQGNRIGLDITATGIVANGGDGINHPGAGTDNSFLGNSIVGNGGLGIDLAGDGVTANDPGDGDAGSNEVLNFPVVTAASEALGTVTVDFDLDVPAGDYHVEVFTNPSGVDGSGFGEGESLASSTVVTHTGSGVESFQLTYTGAIGDEVTLTATETAAGPVYGATSEFSAVATVGCNDTDGDSICDLFEDANTDLDGDPATNPGPDTDADTIPDYLDADDDGDGAATIDESPDPDGDNDPADALDTDSDTTPDYLDPAGGTDCTAQSQVPQSECDYLVSLAVAADSGTWVDDTGWLAHSSPCAWTGVVCDATNVIELRLASNGLAGSVPSDVDDLTALIHLDLSNNALTGSFPSNTATIATLQTLRLDDNELTGSIPVGYGALASLATLDLDTNLLSGPLPGDLGASASLLDVDLSHNQLSGAIPAGYGSAASLAVLDLQNNDLTGSIPTTFNGLTSLIYLGLQNNGLTGPIPVELGSMPVIEWLMLHENDLSGTIPNQLGTATSLRGVVLHGNALTGDVPIELSNLALLEWLTLHDNTSLGPVPAPVANLSGLVVYSPS